MVSVPAPSRIAPGSIFKVILDGIVSLVVRVYVVVLPLLLCLRIKAATLEVPI